MVAIYRAGYGYIDADNGMTISGLEDEFRFAQERGIPTLVYVARDSHDRDPRLAAIIQEAAKHHTLYYYDEPAELTDRAREDLTALITSRFLGAGLQRGVLQETSAELLARSARRTGSVLKREALLKELAERLCEVQALCVFGPAGIGKTTLVAQLAEAEGATFVRASGLARRTSSAPVPRR